MEQFPVECCKTKHKVITLANQKGHKPIKSWSNNMWQTQSAGKRQQASQDRFWIYFLIGRLVRDFLPNRVAKWCQTKYFPTLRWNPL